MNFEESPHRRPVGYQRIGERTEQGPLVAATGKAGGKGGGESIGNLPCFKETDDGQRRSNRIGEKKELKKEANP